MTMGDLWGIGGYRGGDTPKALIPQKKIDWKSFKI